MENLTQTEAETAERRQELFDAAVFAQTQYWQALLDLEGELGIELDGNDDLTETDLETLLARATEDDPEESIDEDPDPFTMRGKS